MSETSRAPNVVFVTMPFGPIMSPALGASLLKGGLARVGIDASLRYFSIDFAQRVGERFYTHLANARRPALRELAGEWIFSGIVSPKTNRRAAAYVEKILRRRAAWGERAWSQRAIPARTIQQVERARSLAPSFIDRCCDEVVTMAPAIVGFTSTFQQHLASLALARRIKERLPETKILFGGANCEGVMGAETVRSFSFVDAVVSGEGDLVVPQLVERLLRGERIDDLPGVYTRSNVDACFARDEFPNAPAVVRMDDLPVPDFSDFFQQFRRSRFDRRWEAGLYFETSRGCWWGAKSHCTFCGLNGTTMAFRSKSPQRALDELRELTTQYPGCDVQVSDNILDLRYFETFLPALAEEKLAAGLFYETKANLRKDQIRTLRSARIHTIQPGIESLADPILQLMRKGVSALQNIQLLKWCKELGVTPLWNLLWGFPGEPQIAYQQMAELVPHLTHLPPPTSFAGIRMDRFSPNFFDARRLGFRDVKPLRSYRYLYDLDDAAITNLAYYFEFQYAGQQQPRSYVSPLIRALRRWQKQHSGSDLFCADLGSALAICDLRPAARQPLVLLRGVDRELYLACDGATGVRQLSSQLGVSPAAIEPRLENLVARRLVIKDEARYLSLAVAPGDYVPPPAVVQRFRREAQRLARTGSDGLTIRYQHPRVRSARDATPRFELRQSTLTIH